MAARRLIILMLVLLVASSVAAALVPVDADRLRDSSTVTTTNRAEAPGRRGELVLRKIDADRGEPARIAIVLGDQLALTVSAHEPDLVEIAGLGALEDVDPNAPASFDLLPFEAGTYAVRLLSSGRVIGRIEVGEPARSRDGAAK